MAKTDIRKFRHDLALLKRKGLISGVDARSATPSKKLTNIIDRFDDVLSGKATPVKLSKSETANMKAAGYDVYKGRVLFPHSAGEKVGVSHGHAKVRQPSGVEKVTIPIPYHDLERYLKDLKKHDTDIDSMKRKDQYFAFRFYGHQSYAIYRDIDSLLADLAHYDAIEGARKSGRAKDMNEVYRNLEIVRVNRSRDWAANRKRAEERRRKEREYNPTQAKAARAKWPEWRKEQHRQANAKRQQAFRDRLSGADLKAYNKAGQKRANKSRRKNVKKGKTGRTRS